MKVLVTGGTSGIGRSVTLQLGRNGHHVDVVGGMSVEKGGKLQHEFAALAGSLQFFPVDLGSIDAIKGFAASYLAQHDALDVAFLNAGTYVKQPHIDKNGLDTGFVVNYLHKFLFLLLLNPVLRASNGRAIINGSSNFARPLKLEKDIFAKRYSGMSGMMQATYANAYVTYWLNKTFQTGVPVQSINPGYVTTGIMQKTNFFMRTLNSLFGISPDTAAQSIVPVIEGQDFKRIDGIYIDKGKKKAFSKRIQQGSETFLQLWKVSLESAAIEAPDWRGV